MMAPGDRAEEIILPQLGRLGYSSIKEMLQDLHVVKKIGWVDIGLKVGLSSTTIATLGKKYGIKANARGSGGRKRWRKDMRKHFI
jgi:hypothetical protein